MGYRTVLQRSDGEIGVASGTSFSSPVMAGMAACLWQENPTQTMHEIKAIIEESGHQYNMPDSLLGYGVPNMEKASQLLNPTAVANKMLNSDWMVYPNPFKNSIVLQNTIGNNQEELKIELYSISGQLLKQWNKPGSRKVVLSDIPELGNGMFLLQISAGHQSETFKLSKSM
jgi:hypothetical protein